VPCVVIHESVTATLSTDAVLRAVVRDEGDVWVVGLEGSEPVDVGSSGRARLFLRHGASEQGPSCVLRGVRSGVQAFIDGVEAEVQVLVRDIDLFHRVRGVFETDVLSTRRVAIVGCGSGGSFIARELAKAGVGEFLLIDHDRMEPGNVCRHECGLSEVGRKKVFAIRDLILDRNPTAVVETLAVHLDGSTVQQIQDAIGGADLVVGATDNRESRLLLNRACIANDQPLLFGAVFRRAYGGQVLRVLPRMTPCYQCFLNVLPQMSNDQEVASAEDAAAIAYSDRPVAIEPGLSSDVLPVALMMVKIAIVLLLEGEKTTLAPLREDLVAPLYLWLNRREPGTDYAKLPPLEHRVDDMTILRWYGVLLPRDPDCAACGAFEDSLLERYGLGGQDLDTDFFSTTSAVEDPS
jgi:molybdopterin/thiamine biosynthesis adenylyltransferase